MASVSSPRGIPLSKISPAFLHANSTSHTWAFSAFAELIDNAYDPDVSASELLIDKMEINGNTCLIFLDNGAGMDTDHLLKMLSFGFCEKKMYEQSLSHLPIGHYGNGFKSGSMRLGKDALVFTRCQTSASIGFLSQTYLKAIGADSVFVPILSYRLPNLERIKSQQSRNNLEAILTHSVFKREQDLKEELHALEGSKTGTKIILSHLKTLQGGTLELDFHSDESDIRCPEAHEVDRTSVYHRPVQQSTSEYKHSLKEYCSMLFLRPRMKITIRSKRVKSRLVSKSLSNTETDSYKPTWLNQPLKITFGFTCDKTKTKDYGMMLYHRNRLIKAFEKVGYQKQPNDLGIGVVGVAQVDFLQPTHNKQDFNKDEKFNSVMMAFATKLNDYWNEKKQNTPTQFVDNSRTAPDWTWAQCDQCLKWRRLPDSINKKSLPDKWFCRLNPDGTHNRCEIPEEPEDEDLAVKPSYVKTFKRKKEEMKRQEQEKQWQDRERRMIREIELKQKEAERARRATNSFAILTQRPPSENLGAVNHLQKTFVEAQQIEESQKKYVQRMQEEKRIYLPLAESLKHSKVKNENVMEQVSEFKGTIAPDSSGNPNITPQKRKIDSGPGDSPRSSKRLNIKEEVSESSQDAYLKPKNPIPQSPSTSTSGKVNTSKQTGGVSSPLNIKISGIVNASNKKQDQDAVRKGSSFPNANEKKGSLAVNDDDVIIVSDDLDYEITINEDYESDQDVKPDVKELKLRCAGEKGSGSQVGRDVKPDKVALDRSQGSEKTAIPDKRPAVNKTLLNLKNEMPEKEATSSKAKAVSNTPSADDGPNRDADSDEEMPPADTHSLKVDMVLAAIVSKLKQSPSGKKNDSGNDEGPRGSEDPVQTDYEENVVEDCDDKRPGENEVPMQRDSMLEDSEDVRENGGGGEKEVLDEGMNSVVNKDDGNDVGADDRIEGDSDTTCNDEDGNDDEDYHDVNNDDDDDNMDMDKPEHKVFEIKQENSLENQDTSGGERSELSYVEDKKPSPSIRDNGESRNSFRDDNNGEKGVENECENVKHSDMTYKDEEVLESGRKEQSEISVFNSESDAEDRNDVSAQNSEEEMDSHVNKSSRLPASNADSTSDENRDQAIETGTNSSLEIVLCHRSCQTDPITSFANEDDKMMDGKVMVDADLVEGLHTKLQVKAQLLEKNEQRVQGLLENIHHLLGLLSPGGDLGDVRDVEQTVKTMIQSREMEDESSCSLDKGE